MDTTPQTPGTRAAMQHPIDQTAVAQLAATMNTRRVKTIGSGEAALGTRPVGVARPFVYFHATEEFTLAFAQAIAGDTELKLHWVLNGMIHPTHGIAFVLEPTNFVDQVIGASFAGWRGLVLGPNTMIRRTWPKWRAVAARDAALLRGIVERVDKVLETGMVPHAVARQIRNTQLAFAPTEMAA